MWSPAMDMHIEVRPKRLDIVRQQFSRAGQCPAGNNQSATVRMSLGFIHRPAKDVTQSYNVKAAVAGAQMAKRYNNGSSENVLTAQPL